MLADELTSLADLPEPRAYPHPFEQVEGLSTHISQLFLAGDFAYKFKRPVSLGFVDFSILERRRFYCEEELRLNRRLAPQLYLDVVLVLCEGAGERVRFGAQGEGEVIDHAVRMRRFPQQALFSRQPLNGPLIDRLAERVADFHASLIPAPESRTQQRQRGGRIRECHGDMHRGNIVVLDGEPVSAPDAVSADGASPETEAASAKARQRSIIAPTTECLYLSPCNIVIGTRCLRASNRLSATLKMRICSV